MNSHIPKEQLMSKMSKSTGFTLIELLIVVAIIGILAAIAVPNFLNAQTRARIANVQSDFNAISTAMESYQIDHNRYPTPFMLHLLTTPIAYIASVPQDPFPPSIAGGGAASGQGEAGASVTWYRYVSGDPSLRTAHCADYWAYFAPFLLRSAAVARANQLDCPTRWLVKSFGPNVNTQALCGGNGDDCTFRYDGSNGLRSIGDIAVFGPGGMQGQ